MTGEIALESGYGRSAPPGDNLCNDFQQENAHSFATLSRARGDRVRRVEGELTMTDASSPLPFVNRAVLEQPIADVEHTVRQLRDNCASSTNTMARGRSSSTAPGPRPTCAATVSC